MKRFTHKLPIFLLLLHSIIGSAQDTIHVPQEQATIQLALDAAVTNSVILVSPGIYTENLEWPGSRYGIKLIGISGRDSTIIDGNQQRSVITKTNGVDDFNALIQGFTIRNGSSNDHGGGIHIWGKGMTLRDLIITDNNCANYSSGGGVYLTNYAGTIDNCIIKNNNALSDFASNGGGMYLSTAGDVTILNSTFENNTCGGQISNSANGAGLYAGMGDTRRLTIRNCHFTGNSNFDQTWTRGGGVFFTGGIVDMDSCIISGNHCGSATHSYGGGIYSEALSFTLTNSQVISNRADSALAILLFDEEATDNVILNSRISNHQIPNQSHRSIIELSSPSSTLEMRNCLVDNNRGMAIKVVNTAFGKSSLLLSHCTIVNSFSGALSVQNTNTQITNSILDNRLSEITLSGTQSVKVNSSFVKGGYTGGGNIAGDAMFNPANAFHLLDGSPCLSSANPAFAEANDYFGNVRPQPSYTLPDMGAIETHQKLSYVDVRFFYDINENGLRDTEERYTEIGAVQNQHHITYNNTRKEGLRIYVDTGMVSFEYDTFLYSKWKVTNQALHQFEVDTAVNAWAIEFGMAPKENKIEVHAYMVADPFRCNENANLYLTLSNDFIPIIDHILWLQIDDRLSSFAFQPSPDTMHSDHLVGWKIAELYPAESVHFEGTITVPGIGGDINIGDHFSFKTWLDDEVDETLVSYDPELRCSFDPNDKLVNPSRSDSLALVDEPLHYTIRFQNTGNDYARNVMIIDSLDANLDMSTFRLIHTSHPEHISVVIEGHMIRFVLNDIFLLDSTTNFEASQGHVSFTIKALPGSEQVRIDNKGSIFFDFNPAIITNTTSNLMVKSFTVGNHEPSPSTLISVYPNPTDGLLYFSKVVNHVYVYNMEGKLLKKVKDVSQMDIALLHEGMVVLKMVYQGVMQVQKIVLMK